MPYLDNEIDDLWAEIDDYATENEKSELIHLLLEGHFSLRELYNIKKENKLSSK